VVVALGDPGVPVACCARAGKQVSTIKVAAANANAIVLLRMAISSPSLSQGE
jgi:hypothetical protein